MPRNQVSLEELRVRIMKLKHEVDWEPTPYQAEKVGTEDIFHMFWIYWMNIDFRG